MQNTLEAVRTNFYSSYYEVENSYNYNGHDATTGDPDVISTKTKIAVARFLTRNDAKMADEKDEGHPPVHAGLAASVSAAMLHKLPPFWRENLIL